MRPLSDELLRLGFDARYWSDWLTEAQTRYPEPLIARIGADFGVEHRVHHQGGSERATLAGRFRHDEMDRPAVGDFVVLIGAPGAYTIVDILPRKTALVRKAAGRKTQAQVVAANVDVVFVVTSFNEDFNINRIERYVRAATAAGARAVVAINKRDLVDEERAEGVLTQLRARVGADAEVVDACGTVVGGLQTIRAQLSGAETAVFVGSSGVGKSTIINALIGSEHLATGAVRESDSRGRHTTTHRELVVLPDGAIVIDTPGMREFQPWEPDEPQDDFADIVELAQHCQFRDCTHAVEPGCAVRAAIDDGEVDEQRLQSWVVLEREANALRVRRDEVARRRQGKQLARVVREAKTAKKNKTE